MEPMCQDKGDARTCLSHAFTHYLGLTSTSHLPEPIHSTAKRRDLSRVIHALKELPIENEKSFLYDQMHVASMGGAIRWLREKHYSRAVDKSPFR